MTAAVETTGLTKTYGDLVAVDAVDGGDAGAPA